MKEASSSSKQVFDTSAVATGHTVRQIELKGNTLNL